MICAAELHLADDFGDNHCTIRCRLDPGHELPHQCEFTRSGAPVVITFFCDEQDVEPEDGA